MTYLVNRLERLLGHDEAVRLSPWRIVDKVQKNIRGMMQNQVKILDTAMSHIMPPKFVQVRFFFFSFIYIDEVREFKTNYNLPVFS